MDEALGVGDVDGEGTHADSTESDMTGNDDRRRWVELHDVLHPRLDVTDEMAVDEVRRCPTVQIHGELERARSTKTYEERVANVR